MKTLTADRLRRAISYNRRTGVFTWKRRPLEDFSDIRSWRTWNTRFACAVAGTLDKGSGYVRITIDGVQYWAHRLAWFYVHGCWPPHDIDHRDTIRNHNWLRNLRCLTRGQNLQNKRKANANSSSGILGVSWDARKRKWKVGISVNDRTVFVGRFSNKLDASAAYKAKKREVHEACTL